MSKLLPVWIRHPSLRVALLTIVLLVLLPTLGVVAMALLNAVHSSRMISEQRLLETSHILAQSSTTELEATTRLLYGLAHGSDIETASRATNGLTYAVWSVTADGQLTGSTPATAEGPGEPALQEIILAAAQSHQTKISNILPPRYTGDLPRIALALPDVSNSTQPRVATVVGHPTALIRTLADQSQNDGDVILAITDGTGRLIARSVDEEKTIGRPVPDWDTLMAIGSDSGTFRAQTMEGRQIIFAFQEIRGTPGWMAVVGEPVASFEQRWQRPILTMIAASATTIIAGLVLALALLRKVQAPIRDLAARAKRISSASTIGQQEESEIPPAYIHEFELLRNSLDESDRVMRQQLTTSRSAEARAVDGLRALEQAERLARIGSWRLDSASGRFTSSVMMMEMNGVAPGEEITIPQLQKMMPAKDFARVGAAIEQCLATGEPYQVDVEHYYPEGGSFRAEIRGQAIRNDAGRIIGLSGTVQDVSEREEARAQMAAIADSLPNGAIYRIDHLTAEIGLNGETVTQSEMRISYVSAGIERLLGITPEALMANPGLLVASIHPDDLERYLSTSREATLKQINFECDFRFTRADGVQRWMQIRSAPRQLEGGRIWDGIMLDVTAAYDASEALRKAKEAAEAAERAKSEFLATMSHEIRTPMNSVIGMSRLALQTQLDPKQRNYLKNINDSANVLLDIINDVLDFSKIEAGGLTLESTIFPMEGVLDRVSTVTALRAEEKGIELTFALSPGLPAQFVGDPLRLGQVLTNLVGNAVKFTEKGDVVVSVTSGEKDGPAPEGKTRLRFSVRDTGIGLSEDQIARLFNPFVQGETATTRKYGGTGLGLAICRSLVEAMGGRIWVESSLGQGSTFHFTVDLDPAPESAIPLQQLRAASILAGRNVLVVDDNDSARLAISDMLQALGLLTTAAADGYEALRLLAERTQANQPFDIVVLDWHMPGLDGLEVARQIRNDPSLPQMPALLMVTAHAQPQVMAEADRLGMQGVLIKPVNQSTIFNRLNEIFSIKAPRTISPDPGPTQPAMEAGLAGRHVLVVDDNALNREVAGEFLELVGIRVETANDGAEAIRKMEATAFDAVLMDVHMPVMDGLTAIRAIRARPEWADLPVIALTAQAQVEDELTSIAAGMSAHLSKPLDETQLYRLLHRFLNEADAATTRLAQLEARFGGNPQRMRRFLSGFLRDFSDMTVHLDRIYASGDLEELANYAHRIRGVVGYLEDITLLELSGQIEDAARKGDGGAVAALSVPLRQAMVDCLAMTEALMRLSPEPSA